MAWPWTTLKFSPIAKLNLERVILPVGANFAWPLYQLDVKNAHFFMASSRSVYGVAS